MAADPNEIIWDAPTPAAGATPHDDIVWDAPAAPTAAKRMTPAQEKSVLGQINDPRVTPDVVARTIRDLTGSSISPDEVVRVRKQSRSQGSKVMGFNYEAPGQVGVQTQEPDNSWPAWLGHKSQVVANALSPYFMAGAAGAAAGAPFAGVGAIPGAAGGVASLGLANLGATAYNAASPLWNGQQMQLPSETIRQQMQKVGVGEAPRTTGERILSAGVEGAAGGFGNAAAANQFANLVSSPTTRRVLTVLGEAPKAQTAAGAGSAAAGQGAAELGLGPTAQLAASLAGGVAGGYAGATRPKIVTPEAITAKAQAAYKTAEDAGVAFTPSSVATLGAETRQALSSDPNVQFHPTLHPRISVALKELDDLAANANGPISFSRLEMARRVANEARKSVDPSERRLGHLVIEKIDDFVQNPPAGGVVGGGQPEAAAAIKEARTAWRQKSQAEALDTAVAKASNAEGGLTSTNLRTQIRQIVNNPNRLRQFDPETQKALKNFVGNVNMVSSLQTLGKISPSFNANFSLKNLAYAAGGATSPYVAVPIAALGMTAKGAANSLAKSRVTSMANKLRGTPDFKLPAAGIGMATATQAPLGQVLQGYGIGPSGESYPVYGEPSKNSNTMPRR